MSIYLENMSTSLSSREQLAIADFAKSLLVIPKTLTGQCCQGHRRPGGQALHLPQLQSDYLECFVLIADLQELKLCGLDLYKGVVRDSKKTGVFETAISTEAMFTLINKSTADVSGRSYIDLIKLFVVLA